MAYDFAAYQADRATMAFDDPLVVLTERGLKLRRGRLALRKDEIDQAAVDAAHARLLAWAVLGEAEPAPEQTGPPETQPFSGSEPPPYRVRKRPVKRAEEEEAEQAARNAKRLVEDRVAWEAAMAGQQERHERRRSAYLQDPAD